MGAWGRRGFVGAAEGGRGTDDRLTSSLREKKSLSNFSVFMMQKSV